MRIAAAGGVDIERTITDGRVVVAAGVVRSARSPMAVLSMPVVLLESALKTIGRVVDAGGVVIERIRTGGRVVGAASVVKEGVTPLAVFRCRWCCIKRCRANGRIASAVC